MERIYKVKDVQQNLKYLVSARSKAEARNFINTHVLEVTIPTTLEVARMVLDGTPVRYADLQKQPLSLHGQQTQGKLPEVVKESELA